MSLADHVRKVYSKKRKNKITDFPYNQLEDSAMKGNAQSQYDLACHPKTSFDEVLKWYELSAEQGHVGAQFELGEIYYHGEGLKKDLDKAGKWFKKAAEQGHKKSEIKYQEIIKNKNGKKEEKEKHFKK